MSTSRGWPRPRSGLSSPTRARNKAITELPALGEQWGGQLDTQDVGEHRRGRPLSESGAKARLYYTPKDASVAHLIQVNLQSETFSLAVDEDKHVVSNCSTASCCW